MIDLFLNSWFLALIAGTPTSEPSNSDDVKSPVAVNGSLRRDTELIVQIRRALARDEALAKANIRVQVREGTVLLSGPVPDGKLIARAVQETKKIRGVLEIKNELRVVVPVVELPLVFGPPASEAPTKTTTAMVPREPKDETVLVVKSLGDSPGQITLGAPILPAPRDAGAPTRVVSYSVTRGEVSSLTAAIEEVRKRDRDYRIIQVEVRNNTLVLRGGASGNVLMAFARNLRGIEGVERVVINTNQAR